MTVQITRHFATVGERQVHYRRAGSGPPVFLLNQSPNSSTEYIPLIQRLAARYTVFAPDTPGNGLSDPLPIANPTMPDFADALAALFDELDIGKAAVYGYHTGGLCALQFAVRHPERAAVTITNGYLHMEESDRQDILEHYFAELSLDWAGSHLTWIWARMRDQYMFFPWFKRNLSARTDWDLPSNEHIHQAVMEILRAGDAYRGPYRCAFTFRADEAVQQARAPAVVMTSKEDVLYPGMDRMPEPAASVRTFRPETHAASEDLLEDLLAEYAGEGSAPALVAARPMAGGLWSDYLRVGEVSLRALRNTDGSGRPVVLQHASAGSSRSCAALMEHFIGRRPVLAVDLPGHGESDKVSAAEPLSVADQAKYLAGAIRAAGYSEVDVVGDWGGGTVGIELSVQEPELVRHLAIPNLLHLDAGTRDKYLASYTPDLVPDEYGTHLIKAWNMVRDQQLFAPWFERQGANAVRSHEPELDPEILHQRTMDLLKCADIYQARYASHFAYPVAERLPQAHCPVLIGEGNYPGRDELAALASCDVRRLPYARDALTEELLGFFSG
jgi:pimeloyl-ACP methyl ester carboxylesterase